MRYRGTIIRWDDDKGFGFVEPDDGTKQVFFHHSALRQRLPRPRVGDFLSYELQRDTGKGPRAADALLQPSGKAGAPPRAASGSRNSAPRSWPTIAAGLLLPVLGAAMGSARRDFIPDWVAVIYVAASFVTFAAYDLDKIRATRDRWRISEGTLHLLEIAGGWPGAFAAHRLIRHKNRKWQFQLVYWMIVAAHLAFWGWFVATQRGWLKP
jgi:uncharacterized membrane protein YsdA (DUF1294 family)/cold shock CspA family protein